MKIVHICLEAPYIDGWAYQENILPECHAKLNHDVTVIGSRNGLPYYIKKTISYENKIMPYIVGKVKVVRIKRLWSFWGKLDYYPDLPKILEMEKPDLLYHHGGQSLSILASKNYKKKYPNSKLIVDFHADYYNTASNMLSKLILHKLIWRRIIHHCLPFIDKMYCITPSVKKLCSELYNIKDTEMEYLYLGSIISPELNAKRETIRKEIRSKLGLSENAFLLITGGKLNKWRNLDITVDAFKKLNDDTLNLIVFGSPDPEDEIFIKNITKGIPRIHMIGWINTEMITKYYLAADLALFPGRESVLWQLAIGTGLPIIIKKWYGTEYLNKGNAIFLYSDRSDELAQWILFLSKKESSFFLEKMRNSALQLAGNELSYMVEAKYIIDSLYTKSL